MAGFARPQHVVGADWVAAHLEDPALRVFDCTVHFRPTAEDPYAIESGRRTWEAGHIPGSGFLDLEQELSDTTRGWRYTMPPAGQFAEAMSRHGVGEGTGVVLYSASHPMWAARVWWMLRAFGFDAAAVLNGGWETWVRQGRPISTSPCRYPPARFVPRPRPALIAETAQVRDALDAPNVRLVNALSRTQHAGAGLHYGRPGRIPGSVCVPAVEGFDRVTGEIRPADALRSLFAEAGVTPDHRVITYCGAGIAASLDALLLTLLGYDDVAVYDGSLAEWSRDASLPMATGEP